MVEYIAIAMAIVVAIAGFRQLIQDKVMGTAVRMNTMFYPTDAPMQADYLFR